MQRLILFWYFRYQQENGMWLKLLKLHIDRLSILQLGTLPCSSSLGDQGKVRCNVGPRLYKILIIGRTRQERDCKFTATSQAPNDPADFIEWRIRLGAVDGANRVVGL